MLIKAKCKLLFGNRILISHVHFVHFPVGSYQFAGCEDVSLHGFLNRSPVTCFEIEHDVESMHVKHVMMSARWRAWASIAILSETIYSFKAGNCIFFYYLLRRNVPDNPMIKKSVGCIRIIYNKNKASCFIGNIVNR